MKIKSLIILAFLACLFPCCKKEGAEGKKSLIDMVIEPKGTNCSSGGYKIVTGIDLNRNDVLDANEIQQTEYVCNGHENISLDKVIRLEVFLSNGLGTNSNTWFMNDFVGNFFLNFNKQDYSMVDSIVFAAIMRTEDVNTKCMVELYNVTDGLSIENSLIETNSTNWDIYYSKDIYNSLPSKKINLGARIKAEPSGTTYVRAYSTYLYIYRH